MSHFMMSQTELKCYTFACGIYDAIHNSVSTFYFISDHQPPLHKGSTDDLREQKHKRSSF